MAPGGLCIGCPFQEKGDRDLKNVRNLLQPTGTDPVRALFVFLNLLKSQAERIAELLLAHSQHHPAHADPASDMLVGRVWRLFCKRSHGASPPFSSMPIDSKSVTIETAEVFAATRPRSFLAERGNAHGMRERAICSPWLQRCVAPF